jgi:hypothetical protein
MQGQVCALPLNEQFEATDSNDLWFRFGFELCNFVSQMTSPLVLTCILCIAGLDLLSSPLLRLPRAPMTPCRVRRWRVALSRWTMPLRRAEAVAVVVASVEAEEGSAVVVDVGAAASEVAVEEEEDLEVRIADITSTHDR